MKGTQRNELDESGADQAEKLLLGAVLDNPAETIPKVIEFHSRPTELFGSSENATIFQAVLDLFETGDLPDRESCRDKVLMKLKTDYDQSETEHFWAAHLFNEIPDNYHLSVKSELDSVYKHYAWRKSYFMGTDLMGKATYKSDPSEIISSMSSCIDELTLQSQGGSPDVRKQVTEMIGWIEHRWQNKGARIGVTTGLEQLDDCFEGIDPGSMVTIAARPSVGKTAFALNVLKHVSIDCGEPSIFFSMEMPNLALHLRLTSILSGVSGSDMRKGNLFEGDFAKLTKASSQLSHAPIIIDDQGGMNITTLRYKVLHYARQLNVSAVFVDYLQLMQGMEKRQESRNQEIADISSSLKNIAKELGCVIFVLSQLNRDVEKGPKRKPKLSDLRDSGSIEQDSDIVIMLHNEGESSESASKIEALVRKHRNGATTDVPLTYLKSLSRFHNYSHEQL